MSLAYVPMSGVGELSFSLKPPKAVRKAVSAVAAKLKPPAAVRKVLSVVAPIAAVALPVVGGALAATKIGKAVAASKSAARAAKAAKTVGDLKKVADTRTAPIRRLRDAANRMSQQVQNLSPDPVLTTQPAASASASTVPVPVVTTTTTPATPDPAPAPATIAQQAAQAAAQGYTAPAAAPASVATTTAEPVLTASTGEGMNWTPILIGGGIALAAFAFMAGRKGGRS